MATILAWDHDSVLERLKNRLKSKSRFRNFLFFSTNQRMLEVVAEEFQEAMRSDEYLTRESKWGTAQEISSLMPQTSFFNYKPHRKIGAVGSLKISTSATFNGDHALVIDVPKFSQFSNGEYTFVTTEFRTLNPGQNYITADVRQGIPKESTFSITSSLYPDTTEYIELEIESDSMDNELYEVYVNGVLWTEIDHIRLAEDGEAQNYVVKNANDFASVKFQFGNDVFGKKLEIGDTVLIKWIETAGSEGNVLSAENVTTVVDSFQDSASNDVDLYCTNDEEITNGEDYEDIEDIRVNAPQSYQTGDRAISKTDYQAIILKNDLADRCIVWGETEVNIDNGNPPGTYIAQEENLVYISGFSIVNGIGVILTEAEQSNIRDFLNDLKGPTDILNFVDTEFVYVTFKTTAYVSDSQYASEVVRSTIENAVAEEYALSTQTFKKSLYFSNYDAFIQGLAGVDHHITALSFSALKAFTSAYVFTLNLNIANIKPNSVKIYVQNPTVSEDWNLIAIDDGAGNFVGQLLDPDDPSSGYYELPGAEINYADGSANEITVTYGLDDTYSNYNIRVDYEVEDSEEGNLLLTKRQQIFCHYDSDVTIVRMDVE